MKYKELTPEQVTLFDESIEYLSDYYITISEDIDDDDETVTVEFPDEAYSHDYTLDDLLDYFSGIKHLKKENNSCVRSHSLLQVIIDTTNSGSPVIKDMLTQWEYKDNNVLARVVENPFLIGVQNCIDDNYWGKYGVTPCEGYLALEIKYLKGNAYKSKDEHELIEQILYHLTQKVGVAVFTSEFWNSAQICEESDEMDEYIEGEEETETKTISFSSLSTYTPMMKLYRQALETQDHEIRFLYFYKAIEFISPIVAKRNVFPKITSHLDTYTAATRDYNYINTLLTLASEYKDNQKDENLAPSVLPTCIDPVPLAQYLPIYLLQTIKNSIDVKPEDDLETVALNEQQRKSLGRQIANILYSTRNSIVHAKSNYTPKGNECKHDDMPTLNQLMRNVVQQLIEWHSKLPQEFQIR